MKLLTKSPTLSSDSMLLSIIPMVTCPTVTHIQVYNGDLRVTVKVPPSEEMHQKGRVRQMAI